MSRYRKRLNVNNSFYNNTYKKKSKSKSSIQVFTVKIKYTVKPKFIQTSSTFLTLSQFIHYSLENGNKIWQELRVELCQNKLILIMLDNFDKERYVMN